MKKIILSAFVAFFIPVKAIPTKKPMMGAYITPDGKYSNPTSRLVDRVISNIPLECTHHNSIALFKKALQDYIASSNTQDQFSTITTAADLAIFIQSMPQDIKATLIKLLRKAHNDTHHLLRAMTDVLSVAYQVQPKLIKEQSAIKIAKQ